MRTNTSTAQGLTTRLEQMRPHEEQITKHFGGNMVYLGEAPIFRNPLRLILFRNRSGSNLLAEYLASSGHFNRFKEVLNQQSVRKKSKRLNAGSFPDYLVKIHAEQCRNSETFGLKASLDQLLMLLRCRINHMYSGIEVVHITRADLIDQAVSFSIAKRTKEWTSDRASDIATQTDFNYADIDKNLSAACFFNVASPIVCKLFDVPYQACVYENIVSRPRETVVEVAKFFGAHLDESFQPTSRIERQANQIKARYKAQFERRARETLLR